MIKILNLCLDRSALCKPAWCDCVVFMCKAFDVNNERSWLVAVESSTKYQTSKNQCSMVTKLNYHNSKRNRTMMNFYSKNGWVTIVTVAELP